MSKDDDVPVPTGRFLGAQLHPTCPVCRHPLVSYEVNTRIKTLKPTGLIWDDLKKMEDGKLKDIAIPTKTQIAHHRARHKNVIDNDIAQFLELQKTKVSIVVPNSGEIEQILRVMNVDMTSIIDRDEKLATLWEDQYYAFVSMVADIPIAERWTHKNRRIYNDILKQHERLSGVSLKRTSTLMDIAKFVQERYVLAQSINKTRSEKDDGALGEAMNVMFTDMTKQQKENEIKEK